jgi:hypothetical protein
MSWETNVGNIKAPSLQQKRWQDDYLRAINSDDYTAPEPGYISHGVKTEQLVDKNFSLDAFLLHMRVVEESLLNNSQLEKSGNKSLRVLNAVNLRHRTRLYFQSNIEPLSKERNTACSVS